jgi:hypothetical protein
MKTFRYLVTLSAAILLFTQAAAQSVLPPVIAPPMPDKIDFAGERVPLENYDTRESLMREMLVTSYMHSRTYLTLLATKRYFAVIEPILERYHIPSDFKYLCMAESSLNPNAVSVAKASGLWQIMPKTGEQYGLEVGSEVDERFHLEKSTEVACKHLLESYALFGSWTLAAAAYNLGNNGVSTRMSKQGTNNYYDSFFPEETLRYVFRILSFKLLTESPHTYGYDIALSEYYPPLTAYTEIEVGGKDIDWSQVARDNGTTYKMLRELNNWIRDYKFANKNDKKYKVKIPDKNFRKAPNSEGR